MKFGLFDFDERTGTLSRSGDAVALGHRGSQLLKLLVSQRGEIVGKAALMDAAWPGQAVEESNLTVQVAALRKTLGTTTDGQDWIATVPRVGYRFLAANAATSRDESGKPASPCCRSTISATTRSRSSSPRGWPRTSSPTSARSTA